MIYQREDQTKSRRHRTELAIQLALQNRWQEALAVNQEILEAFPEDVDTCNRLGKALAELGRYAQAREAYAKALALDQTNTIARKNLERLGAMLERAAPATRLEVGRKVSPTLFISEVGKSGTTSLINTAPEVLTRATVGDEVFLRLCDGTLVVENARGEYLGQLEPKLGLRLLKLTEGGNQYAAAVTSLSGDEARILIKETYQHPNQAGKLSFPPTGGEGFRPYIKESLLKYEADEELATDDELEEWGEGHQTREVESHIYEDQAPVAAEDDEEEKHEKEEEEYEES
ncbi:MAG: tetratricopeptide repeat protein [Dehalococcoidia bacterium]